MKLKIGRHEYDITGDDEFMDNGSCVQLLTQSKERSEWGGHPNPQLSKCAVKVIARFGRRSVAHGYGPEADVFKLQGAGNE